jgi:hypothetical protein
MGPKNYRNYILLCNTERNQTTDSKTDRVQFAILIPDAWSLCKFVHIDTSELEIYLLSYQINEIQVPK